MADRTQLETGVSPTTLDTGFAANQGDTSHVLGSLFPQQILDLGYTVSKHLDASGAQADCYLLTDKDGTTVFAKVYRRGLRPKPEILQRLRGAAPEHVIRLLAFDAGDDGRQAWELLEYAPFGTLGDFIREQRSSGIDTEVARTILQELATALEHIHTLDIEHRDIKPDNILLRDQATFDLVLTDFGIASDNTHASRFTSHAHHSLLYAPPEAQYGHIEREKWDYWSLGMILVELLTGVHPLMTAGGSPDDQAVKRSIGMRFLHMTSGDELVGAVEQADWRQLCRGLLRKDATQRWAGAEVGKWLANPADSSLVVVDERAAASTDAFRFGEGFFESPTHLAAALRNSHEDLRHFWRTDYERFNNWLGSNGYPETQKKLAQIRDDQGKSSRELDLMQVLFRLDESAIPVFAGVELSEAAICELADNAVASKSEAQATFHRLFEENVLTIAAGIRTLPDAVSAVGRSWEAAAREFASEASRVATASSGQWTAEPLGKQGMAPFLASMVAGCRSQSLLRSQALEAAESAASRVTWFRSIGEPESASPAKLLLMVRTAPVAARIVQNMQASITADARSLWRYMARGALIAIPVVLFGIWVAENFDNASFHISPRSLEFLDWLFLGAILVAWGASNASAFRQATGVESDG